MSTSKRILSFIMALAMVMTMFSGVGTIFASAADAEYYTGSESVIDTLADIEGYATGDFYLYIGVDYYEKNAAGAWELTDHYVQPGADLRGEVHLRTNMYTGSGMAIYFNFDRNFFDVTNGKGATYPTTANSYDPNKTKYPTENYPYNIGHDSGDGTAFCSNPIVDAEAMTYKYTTKWARNLPGFKEATNANFHNVPLAESDEWDFWYVNIGTGTVSADAFKFETDAGFFTFDVKVREFMPDGTTKLADGTTGSVALDKRCYTIYDNAAHAGTTKYSQRVGNIGTSSAACKESAIKRMNIQTWFTIDDFYTDDCNHTFTIGANPDNAPSYGESVVDTLADIEGYATGDFYLYIGVDYLEFDASTGEWNYTDHYVNAGDTIRGEVHLRTNMYTGSGMAIYFNFDRNFFDVTNGKGATYPTTANSYDPNKTKYPTENYPYNIGHDSGDGTAFCDNPIVDAEAMTYKYTTKWARNLPGFKEATNANFHNVPLAVSDEWDFWYVNIGTGTVSADAFKFETDAGFFTFDVKVREFMPDGTTKLADGTTGSVALDKRCYTIYDNAEHAGTSKYSQRVGNIGTSSAACKESAIKRMNIQTWFTIDDFYTDDCNHTFTIGKPSAGGKEHTATFTVDGETYGNAVSVKEGAEIAAPADAPVKAGYTFKGWALEGTTAILTFPQTMGKEDVTYVAIFEALPKYTATFYADGVQVGEVKEYYEGDTIVAPVAPTKTGYTFVEWNPEVGVMGSANVTFNAVYAANTYAATWIVDGDVYDETTVTFDAAYEHPTAPAKDGYSFDGWYADAAFETPIANIHAVDEDVIFFAKFTANVYTITFDTAGGSAIAPVEYAYGAAVDAPAAPTKTGFTFAGWSPALPTTMPANNVTVVAQWTAVASGAFFYNGDELVAEIPGVYGDVITVAQVPTVSKLGYSFKGWFDASGNEVTFPQTLGTEALTVYAAWDPVALYIEFYNGSEWLDGGNQTVGNAIVAPEAPAKTGYEFAGWVDADGNAMPETVPAAAAGTQLTYYASYDAILYDAVFMNDGVVYDTVKGAYQSAINAPATNPTKEGYEFQYWAKEGTTAKVDFTKAKMPINGVTYVAIYKINSYTVTYFVDDVQVWQDTYQYGADITPYAPEFAEGTTFTGFGEIPATMPAENLEFRGYTGVANYTVTFTVNGEEYDTLTFAYGAVVTAPAYNVEAGYSFSGWDLPATMPAENITLDATLTINKYWARFWLDEAKTQLYHEVEVTYGEDIEFPEDPSAADIPGHTFDFWDDDTIVTMPAYNVDYVAVTNKIPYTIAFVNEDGSAIAGASWTGYYGDVITVEDAPVVTKEGFEFKGWAVDGEVVALPFTVTGSTTFTATFGVVSYDVIWVVDGKVLYTDSYDFGDAIVMRADEVKEGYTFSGWDTDLEGMTMPAEDIEVNGSFTVNVYNAYFYAEGELIATVPTNFGEVPVAPTAPDKTGYAFAGWTPALAPMVVAEDGVRYDAVYSAGAVAYVVEVYTMDTEGNYGAPEVLNFTANADADVSYAPAAKNGFTVSDNSVLAGKAAADGSTVLTVYYDRNQYTFTTVVDGETTEETYYYEEAVVAPEAPVKEGYEFIGWDGTVPATMPARNVTLTARFRVLQFTITFNTDGGTTINAIKADYGTAVNKPADPTKTGYTFAGWDAEIPATIPAENVTITALWTINQYTITFVDTDWAAEDTVVTYDYNAAVAEVAAPSRTGYTFTGWDVEIPANMPAKDLVITATWVVNEYDAIFVINGVETVVKTAYGAMPVAPNTDRLGYTFTGWDNEVVAMPAESVTYVAQYSANTYEAIFDADGGKWADGETSKTVATVFDTAIVAPEADPTREGFIFVGWTPEVGNMTTEGIVFKAVWTQDLNFCRVQSVTRVTANVYGPQLANYEIKVMGSPVKVQLCYADATNVTWTFDRNDAKIAADGEASGLVSVVAYEAGTADAYEIWTIRTVLTEDNYKARAKVDYTSSSWESLEFAYEFAVAYDVAEVADTMIYDATASVASIQRGQNAVITVVADASVTRLQLRMAKADGTYTTVTYAPTSSAVSYDDTTNAAENKATWAITVTFTYSGTADSQTQTWEVWYRAGSTTWVDSDKAVEVEVTRFAAPAPVAPDAQAPYSVISVEIAESTVAVATEVKITVVTTNDITRVRLNNTDLGKTATYLKTSKNLVLTEDAEAGTYTWEITYRFGVVADNQQWFAQCRGNSWSDLDKSFTVSVTE